MWGAAAVALGLAACERLDAATDPVWGKEPCAHCAMLVGDRRHAAQIVTESQRRYFDDIGCYVLWAEERPGAARRAWVRDASGAQWIDAKSATYVHGARTPMDFGFEARAAAAGERAVKWDEMRAAVVARARQDGDERSER